MNKTQKRIGVFSGTFDPFHRGHLEACLVAKSVCDLETVLIFIEKVPHRKNNVTDFVNRAEIIDASTTEYPSLQLVDVGDDNVTVHNTTKILENRFPEHEYWFILGSDMLQHFAKWDDYMQIVEAFNFCIVLRKPEDKFLANKFALGLQAASPKTKCEILPPVWSEVSSSKVRSELADNLNSEAILPEALEYIKKHKLYGTA